MPFTLAHPIAALPLWWSSQRRLDLPALIVGAMIPDISYFIALHPVANIGHSLQGIALEGIPSALVLLLVGRYLLWCPVLLFMPSVIACRLPYLCTYRFLPLPRLLLIILSISVGALTHIIWDSFTHSHGWAVRQLSVLSADVWLLPVYKWLQYTGGLFGCAMLLILIQQTLIHRSPQSHTRSHTRNLPPRWKVISGLMIAIVMGLTIWAAVFAAPDNSPYAVIIRVIVGTISGLFLGLCAYATSFWMGTAFIPKIVPSNRE